MAVPKKKMSKSKRNSRKSIWKKKADKQSLKAFSLAKSTLLTSLSSLQYFGYKKDDFNQTFLKEFIKN